MSQPAAVRTHISEIEPFESSPSEREWMPVRHHFDIRSFGINAYVARADGQELIEEHTETEDSGTRHEELFFVSTGEAEFVVDGEAIAAPAGTFVYVRDPGTVRSASARTAGTTVLAMGGEPAAAFEVSPWERKYID